MNLNEYIAQEINSLTFSNPIRYLNNTKFVDINYTLLKKNNYLFNKYNYFNSLKNSFQKNVYLKFLINKLGINSEEIKMWIVKDWGGVLSHKNFQTLEESKKKKLFDRISSWSKIASFENLEDYIIYDAKVIYSLNWFILNYNLKFKKEEKYFIHPIGRNKKLLLLPVEVLINFTIKIDENKKGLEIYNNAYYSKDECYVKCCELIKCVNQLLFKKRESIELDSKIYFLNYPFFTEMLLFSMADDVVFKQIKSQVRFNI